MTLPITNCETCYLAIFGSSSISAETTPCFTFYFFSAEASASFLHSDQPPTNTLTFG